MSNAETAGKITAADFFKGKTIVVTGAVGSVGVEVVRQLLTLDVKEVRALDNNESALFDAEQIYSDDPRYTSFHADIENEWELQRVFSGVDYVFHAAALKHVPSCERSPFSAVHTNILGVQSVIRAAQHNKVKKVLFTSSDKAVSPTNVMGASKLMGERLMTAANSMTQGPSGHVVFSSTRFGNVAGSRGSVVPLFCDQIRDGKSLTVTDSRMTRFMMSLKESAELVIESIMHARGGETFVTKMPTMRIIDLAKVLIEMVAPLYGRDPKSCEIKVVGSRPGEKLWEELSSDEESRRILEGDRYLCILPAIENIADDVEAQYSALGLKKSNSVYNSENEPKMSHDEIREFLMMDGVLPTQVRRLIIERAENIASEKVAV